MGVGGLCVCVFGGGWGGWEIDLSGLKGIAAIPDVFPIPNKPNGFCGR